MFAFSACNIQDPLGSNYPTNAPQYTKNPADLMREAQKRNVPICAKSRIADSIAHGVLDETADHHNIKFILMGWPGPLNANAVLNNPVKVLLEKAKTNGSWNTSNTVPCPWFDNMNSRQYIGFEDD